MYGDERADSLKSSGRLDGRMIKNSRRSRLGKVMVEHVMEVMEFGSGTALGQSRSILLHRMRKVSDDVWILLAER